MKKIICYIMIGLIITGCTQQKDRIIDNLPVNELTLETSNCKDNAETKINQEVEVKEDGNEKKDISSEDKVKKSNFKIEYSKKETAPNKEQEKDNTISTSIRDTTLDSSKSSNNDTVKDEPKKEEVHKHMFNVNAGWFQTESQAVNKFDNQIHLWETKLNKNEISYEEYLKKCPCGYEVYRCTCGEQGLNMLYR